MEEREKLRAKWRDKEDDVRMNGNPKVSELLHAATVCAQALSCSSVDDKVRFLTLSKIIDGLGGDNIGRKLHNHPEVEQHVYVQESCLGGHAHNEKSQDSSQMRLNEGCVQEGQEQLLSFLHKAMAQGALELKDMDSVLRCLRESGKEVWKRKETAQHDDTYVQIPATDGENEQLHVAGNQEHSSCSKEREETLRPMGKDPPVITQVWVPQKMSAPTKGTLSSHVPGDQGKKGQLCLHVPHCLADEKEKEEPHTQPQTRTVHSCSDMDLLKCFPAFMENSEKGVRGNKVKGSTIFKNSIFSDMHSKKGEFCQPFQNFNFKEGETPLPCVSFSNVVKYGKENFCPQEPCQTESKVEEQIFSDFRHSLNKDESSLFRIDPSILEKRMEMCSLSVVGKVSLAKGDSPWLLRKLRDRIESIWSLKSDWRLISLGKGFYHILLNSKEEWDKVWSHGHTSLKPGVLRLQRWSLDFDPIKEKNSNAQVWIRILNLPWCFWEPSVLAGIARKVGVPIRFDKATVESDFGHFARVLVDVDLSKALRNSVHVEYGNHVFEVQIVPENVPAFCRNCHAIGHFSMECKFVTNKVVEPFSTTINNQKWEGKETRNTKVPLETLSNGNALNFELGKSAEASSSHAQMMNSANRNKTSHAPQWRQKKVHANLFNKGCTEVDYEKLTKPLKVTEIITDFGAQLETHKPSSPNGVCSLNQFSILYDLEDIDNEQIENGSRFKEGDFCPSQSSDVNDLDQPSTDDKKDDINSPAQFVEDTGSMKTLTATRQNVITEDSTMDISVKDVCDRILLPPKMPEKWGDLLDEEQDIEKDSLPRRIRDISEIREGLKTIFIELPTREMDWIEPDRSLFQDDPILPITPLHIQKEKKVKIGFRHPKRSSGSSKS